MDIAVQETNQYSASKTPALNGERDTDLVPTYVVITREIYKVGDLPNQTRHHIAHRRTHMHTRTHTSASTHTLNY